MKKIDWAKRIIAGIAIVICLLGLFKAINRNIGIDIVLIMLAVILGIESALDYKKGKKLWMVIDIIAAVVFLLAAVDALFGITDIIQMRF